MLKIRGQIQYSKEAINNHPNINELAKLELIDSISKHLFDKSILEIRSIELPFEQVGYETEFCFLTMKEMYRIKFLLNVLQDYVSGTGDSYYDELYDLLTKDKTDESK